MKKADKLYALELNRRKLEHLVGEMLRKADELDQSVRYGERDLSENWQERLASTCSELATLSEAVASIRALIDAGDTDATQRALLKSTDIATHLSGRLRQIKHSSAAD
jgi:hypothetical protein